MSKSLGSKVAYIIYKTTNKINEKKYIGLHGGDNPEYLGSGKLITSAIKKYGKENFVRTVIAALPENISHEEAENIEAFYIANADAVKRKDYYNLCGSGRAGRSDRAKEYWASLNKEEKRDRLKWFDWDRTGENNPMYGRTREDVKEHWTRLTPEEKYQRYAPMAFRDKTGRKNSRAKKIIVKRPDGIEVGYYTVKEWSEESQIPFSTAKQLVGATLSKKSKYFGWVVSNA
jgi:hypothetical protein